LNPWQVAGRVLLKLFLASIAILASVQLFRLLLLPAIVAVFGPGELLTAAFRRSGIFSFVLLGYWSYVHFYEKRAATELRLSSAGILLGAVAGCLMISITLAALFATGNYVMTAWRGPQFALLGVACVIAIAAMIEEIFFRGVLFRLLEEAWGTTIALWLQAFVFAILHLANADASVSESITTVISVTLIGALWTLMFVATRNLWTVAAHHAAWNFTILLTGVPLSGLLDWSALAPMESHYNGPQWLTGGVFGPEDSVITLFVVVAGLVILVHWSRSRNRYRMFPAPA
jgi:uncharacterized protein